MALRLQLQRVSQLDDLVWKAQLSPSELRFLDPKASSVGSMTVLFLYEAPAYDPTLHQLSFDPASAKVVNAGTTDDAILIANSKRASPTDQHLAPARLLKAGAGDARFLHALPSQLQELGRAIVEAVRSDYPGDLVFYEASGKYVEAPDNFWTIRPQPRDESFRITVRGRPESFGPVKSLEIKPDMTGYSSFKIERQGQIDELLGVLAQVRRK